MKIPKRALIPVVAGAVIGAAALFGATTMGLLPIGAKQAGGETAHAQVKAGAMVPMRERIVNLSDPGILRYLKTSIVLEVFDPENPTGHPKSEGEKKHKEEFPKDLKHKAAPIEDRVNGILSAKTASDLMGPAGKARLKEEIRDEINHLLHEERILAVYFTDFIIQ